MLGTSDSVATAANAVNYEQALSCAEVLETNAYFSRAHETNDRNLQVLWTFLAALSNKQGRREFVRILGFGGFLEEHWSLIRLTMSSC